MSTSPDWMEIAIRLSLTILAGALIGFNRSEHGQPAGLRTTLLVCLAASVSMIQANLLLSTAGRSSDSFVMMDVMRLPLGILSGMGFIGGGVILKRGELVRGVTTAATLWFVTVLGLCFGGGQLAVGGIALVLGLIVLWGLKSFEMSLPQERQVFLSVTLDQQGPDDRAFVSMIGKEGFRVVSFGMNYDKGRGEREYQCQVIWRGLRGDVVLPPFLKTLSEEAGILGVRWNLEEPTASHGV